MILKWAQLVEIFFCEYWWSGSCWLECVYKNDLLRMKDKSVHVSIVLK